MFFAFLHPITPRQPAWVDYASPCVCNMWGIYYMYIYICICVCIYIYIESLNELLIFEAQTASSRLLLVFCPGVWVWDFWFGVVILPDEPCLNH